MEEFAKNNIEDTLSRKQKCALLHLAKIINMRHIEKGIHMLGSDRYYPTKLGWMPVINYNWRDEYRKLERDYENLQILHSMKDKENKEMREIVKMSNTVVSKIWKIVQSHNDDQEKLRQIKRFLMDKKKGGD